MTTTPEQYERKRLIETVRDFFNPDTSFGGKKQNSPTRLGIELAMEWFVAEGKEKAIKILRDKIDGILKNRSAVGEKLAWEEADTLCSQALSLYLELTDESGSGWEERDKAILFYFTELYWQVPDRIVDEREEKTNCTNYLVNESCMLKSKKILISWIVERWKLESYGVLELEKENSAAAFDFICGVFKQEERGSERKTHPENIAVLESYVRRESGSASAFVDKRRILMEKDEKLILQILKEHCAGVKLEDIRPWVRDDLPDEILQLFQKVLIRTPERTTVLKLLKGDMVAV